MTADDERDDDTTPARGLFRPQGDEFFDRPSPPPPVPPSQAPLWAASDAAPHDHAGWQGGAPPGPSFGAGAQPPGPSFGIAAQPPGPTSDFGYPRSNLDPPSPWLDDTTPREAPSAESHWLLDDDQSGLQVPLGGRELNAEPIPGPADDLREPWLRRLLRRRRER